MAGDPREVVLLASESHDSGFCPLEAFADLSETIFG